MGAAKTKYKDDAEVTKFLKEFTGLMATHFEVLSREAPNAPKGASQPSEAQKAIPAPITGLDLAAKPPPAVKPLIGALRAGQPFEMRELGQSNPRLFMKVK